MKKFLLFLFVIAIFAIGGLYGYKKLSIDERKNEIIQMFNKELLNDFVESKKSVMERLKTAKDKEEGNKIYNEYVATNKLMLEKINEAHSELLENVFMADSKYNFTPEEWKTVNNYLKDYDLELIDMGEGNAMIAQVPNFYYDIFKDYVTDDYKDYLELVTKEYTEPYFGIEEILVSHEKIADRLLAWEDFQKKYPNSDFLAEADIEANVYRRAYILGAYNLHTREGGSENPELYYIPDNILKEFNRFIETNPDSPTVEYINFYLENYKNPNIEEILYDKFEKEIVKDYESENSNEPVMKDTLEVITEELRYLNSQIAVVENYSKKDTYLNNIEKLTKKLGDYQDLYVAFSPKGEVKEKITSYYLEEFAEPCNEKAGKLFPDMKLKFVTQDGVKVLTDPNGSGEYLEFNSLSGGEQASVMFLLVSMLSSLSGMGVIILDELSVLDDNTFENLIRILKENSFDMVINEPYAMR